MLRLLFTLKSDTILTLRKSRIRIQTSSKIGTRIRNRGRAERRGKCEELAREIRASHPAKYILLLFCQGAVRFQIELGTV